jgi:hypothetical protein
MFEKVVKKIDVWDIALIKMAVLAFTLAIVALYPSFYVWVQSINPWVFVIAFILFITRPFYRIWIKK